MVMSWSIVVPVVSYGVLGYMLWSIAVFGFSME